MYVKEKILRNSVKCGKCGDEIESRSVHDYRSCKCGAISVDGGKDYLRRVGDIHGYIDTSIMEEVKPRFDEVSPPLSESAQRAVGKK